MSFAAGTQLGVYQILSFLAAGGMGEVYRARDTKLGREIAIKILPATFSRDHERLARFEREARLLASLNHPNIAAIYGFEQTDDLHFLVLELVPGETLAERIVRGPIDIDETLAIFKQIADGLEAAHEKGVVHRDLKPPNVKITPDGIPKILDFGLGKELDDKPLTSGLSESPTLTRGTVTGVILGTAPYMSPEQARGKAVDKRADIWAFGCCLYEALSGKVAFQGDTISDVIAAVLGREPDWQALPQATPPGVRALLRRCLQKDSARRFRDVWDVRVEIEEALAEPSEPPLTGEAPQAAPRREKGLIIATVLVAIIASGIGLWTWLERSSSTPTSPLRFAIPLTIPGESLVGNPSTVPQVGFSLSPQGDNVVFSMPDETETWRLYLRRMDQMEATPIPGTNDARLPFFSPDGEWVGFFAGGKLEKVPILGETVATEVAAEVGRAAVRAGGGSWGSDDSIVFVSRREGLMQVSADGGVPEVVAALAEGETFNCPEILPGGQAVLFTHSSAETDSFDEASLSVVSLTTGQRRKLMDGCICARYSASGQLVFARGGKLLAVPFDLDRLEVTGVPRPVQEGVRMSLVEGWAEFSLSKSGALAYIPGDTLPPPRTVVRVDRQGAQEPLPVEPDRFFDLELSRDGKRLALGIGSLIHRLWIFDLARNTLSPLILEIDSHNVVWAPDGKQVAFNRGGSGNRAIFVKKVDAADPAEKVLEDERQLLTWSWSPDGKFVAYRGPGGIRMLPMDGETEPMQIPNTRLGNSPMFSPDGRWIAYQNYEANQSEIYIMPFPDTARRWQISNAGGDRPVWNPSGGELFYQESGRLMAVEIRTEPELEAGVPRVLFEDPSLMYDYDVSPDGQHFYMMKQTLPVFPTEIHLVLNWSDELKRAVPTN